ncbi:Rieske (2Fe-2S) protein [Blastomonas sp. AAP25]|uniref:aromatic ring-hydroxylating oxygenase subunit alpha n=1 Tax=Blastomonas sp. AAP25 TaxID=1523416 RepID=UPI0006B994D5|nr:aromatic ring-hydroxylating dioxygenase subunit alpha [Blastomonas sp. AAP25]KPF76582.1 Rieske (2Fe-2S) protein [Blastomonas sp. AAP25]
MTNAASASSTGSAPTWPVNAWYVACTPDEIEGKPLGRQICGEHMVFFRNGEGKVAALEDFCPHRGAPLSLGFIQDGALVCGYHGLAMGCNGRTVGMPGQRVKGFPPIRTYPVVERYGFIWVWPGDAEAADPAKLRHLPWAQNDEWAFGGGLYHVACDYRLMIDNLMDLTHENYVHASSIGQKEIDEAPVKTRIEGDEIVTSRFMDGIMAPPFWQMALRGAGLPDQQLVDRWQICRFSLPSSVLIEVGVALAGNGGHEADNAHKASAMVVDFMTPETTTSHWYFWGLARRFAVQDAALTNTIREGQTKIFAEDLEMLERQQRNLELHPERRLLLLNIDAGGVRSRMLIDQAIAAGQAGQAPADQRSVAAV